MIILIDMARMNAKQNTYILPLALNQLRPLFGKWSWGMSAEYDLLWRGRVKSQLSDVYSGFNDPEVEQDFGHGYGLRFSLSLTRSFAGKYAISIQPYIKDYWKIEKSDKEMLTWAQDDGLYYTYVWEPKNETKCYGLRLSIFF